jgi:hypothetical protein
MGISPTDSPGQCLTKMTSFMCACSAS